MSKDFALDPAKSGEKARYAARIHGRWPGAKDSDKRTIFCASRRVLELPVMATPKARTLLPKIIDAKWPDVGKVAASLARRWRAGDSGTAESRSEQT